MAHKLTFFRPMLVYHFLKQVFLYPPYCKCQVLLPKTLQPPSLLTFPPFITCDISIFPLFICLFFSLFYHKNINSMRARIWACLFSSYTQCLKQSLKYRRHLSNICGMNRCSFCLGIFSSIFTVDIYTPQF